MTVKVVTGHHKLYRDLYVDGVSLENIDCSGNDTPGFTRAQRQVVDALGSGDFEIVVEDDGSCVLKMSL